jgi:hypothetical protein
VYTKCPLKCGYVKTKGCLVEGVDMEVNKYKQEFNFNAYILEYDLVV